MSAESDTYLARDLSVSAMRLNRRLRLRHVNDRIPVAQLSILTTIFREGSLTAGELAVRERIKPPSISRSSHALVEMGLLKRVPHATDRRQVVLTLTDEGRRVAGEDVAAREKVLADQLGFLTPQQRTTLAEASNILIGIVERVQ
ncbi:MarR family transcriptional regulator [Rhodococcus sp. G-MC3]|uniref:MarR family transcriptional regulator n=1 Tax=Rhodococcus sp. G-MC3 TaxID=3046209 RepID=UPI0024B925BC|nr:MarR family transcriptional regulator [Rhodococcus sp. G-MC3]MDJ0395586.1 MarR family transcriptional regulator [Rhodococcus sp. G-MC3]